MQGKGQIWMSLTLFPALLLFAMLKLFTLSLLSLLLLLLLLLLLFALFTTFAPTDAAALQLMDTINQDFIQTPHMTKLMKVNPLIDPDGAQSGSAS